MFTPKLTYTKQISCIDSGIKIVRYSRPFYVYSERQKSFNHFLNIPCSLGIVKFRLSDGKKMSTSSVEILNREIWMMKNFRRTVCMQYVLKNILMMKI